jgi:MYXO-CTERM domain-containing protein
MDHHTVIRLIALCAVLGTTACATAPDWEMVPMDIHVSEAFVDFGDVPTGVSVTRTLRVHNAGDADLVLSQVPYVRQEGEHETFALDGTWQVIEPEDEGDEPTVQIDARSYEEMTLTFTPVAQEESFGYVGLYSNDPDEANRVIVLRGGSYVGTPQVLVSPGLVEFGFVASGNSAEQYVQVQNTGEVDVEVLDVSIGGSDSPFEVGGVSAFPIPPGDAMLIPVLFHSDGGDHEVASMTVEIDGAVANEYVVNLSANAPGSTNNSPPIINMLEPTEPTVFYLYQDLELLARAFDAQQPNIGLYCTLESDRLGMVEQETSDPVTSEVTFAIDIDESAFEDETGTHTLTVCCTDVFAATSCETLVVSIDEPLAADDADGDGYGAGEDCDDADATAYPGALELADGVDNDCDAVVDEETVNADDDGDGYAEVDGDCHDADAGIHPGAAEIADFFDNDCDGTIDEDTVNYDDDGDGYSEALGDCDDAQPAVYSGALEWCDGLDNDCDGQTDEDCVDDTPPLEIVGGIVASVVAMNVNPVDPVELTVTTVNGPDACLEYEWWSSGGTFVSIDGPTATWLPPTDEMGDFSVYCRVEDSCSDDEVLEDWAFITLVVTRLYVPPPPGGGCESNVAGTSAAPAGVVLGTLAALWATRRRR